MKQHPPFRGVVDLLKHLKNDADCKTYLKSVLWKGDRPPGCPRCGNTVTYAFADGNTHKCAACRQKFNLLTGTIFENTKLPLKTWIACIYMSVSYKRGISSYQVANNLGVTQKTAWFMMQRVRKLFEQLRPEALEGVCTADETFVGGKSRNKHKNKRRKYAEPRAFPDKITVFGVMQINGPVISEAIPDPKMSTIQPLVIKYVKKKSTLMTDEWGAYQYMNHFYTHKVCRHARGEYVSKDGATTNPIENYWSHVKRAIIGTYYHLTRKHIQRYLYEFDFKFNYRQQTDSDKFSLALSKLNNTRLKYQQLTQN